MRTRCQSRLFRSPGFSHLESLTVLAIIAILIALLLPAVQQAREAARRTSCKNNLMQFGVALSSYQESHGVLPSGCVNATGPVQNLRNGYHASWTIQLLPYLSQQNTWSQIDPALSVYDPGLEPQRQYDMRVLTCPSDFWRRGRSGYAGSTGSDDVAVDVDNNGLFFLNSSIADFQIRDGLSNTLAIGERRVDEFAGDEDLGWMSGTSATLRSGGVVLNSGIPGTPMPFYMDNNVADFGFEDDLGGVDAEPVIDEDPTANVGGFSSQHVGGVQFLLADGSVRFLSENNSVLRELTSRDDGALIAEF